MLALTLEYSLKVNFETRLVSYLYKSPNEKIDTIPD